MLETYGYMAATKTGKHPIVIQIIIEASANGKSVLFVSKNEALNEALKTYLEVEKGGVWISQNSRIKESISFLSVRFTEIQQR